MNELSLNKKESTFSNIKSLLSKVDEICCIAKRTNGKAIGTPESKLDKSIFQFEIQIDNYYLLRCDRNRNGGVVPCYIKSNICYVQKKVFPNTIESISLKFCCPKPHL